MHYFSTAIEYNILYYMDHITWSSVLYAIFLKVGMGLNTMPEMKVSPISRLYEQIKS